VNVRVKMLLRTLQINFPVLLDAKFDLMRRYRNSRRIPFDRDFYGIRLFPIDEDALFLDVGANRGQSTDAILMLTKSNRILLFEPNPLLCERLHRQFEGDKRVVVNEFGLGNRTSEQPLHIPFYKRWMFDGLASFDREKAGTWLEGRILFFKEKHLSLQEVMCKIRRLDDLNLAPFLVKLDVQGYEFEVIQGGEQTIRTHEPVLLIESPPDYNIISFLDKIGYAFYTFRDNKFIRGVAEGNNTFFMTERMASLVRRHTVS
jgi:FkbM family methyltransferase